MAAIQLLSSVIDLKAHLHVADIDTFFDQFFAVFVSCNQDRTSFSQFFSLEIVRVVFPIH